MSNYNIEKDIKIMQDYEAYYLSLHIILIAVNFMRRVVYDKHNK